MTNENKIEYKNENKKFFEGDKVTRIIDHCVCNHQLFVKFEWHDGCSKEQREMYFDVDSIKAKVPVLVLNYLYENLKL